MSERAGGETNDDLIQAAAAHGYTVSKRQLAEWHRAGLLPEPEQVHGERVGSTSLYPAGTAAHLLALCALRQRARRNADVAWGLWWAGYDVPEQWVKEPLQRVAATWREEMQALRQLVGQTDTDQGADGGFDELSDAFLEFLDQMGSARISRRVVTQARKRLSRDNFPTFVRILVEVLTGTFTGYAIDFATGTTDEERALAEVGLGVVRGRTDRVADAGPWLTQDVEAALRELSRLLQQYPPGHGLETATREELARTRDEVKLFLALLKGWSAVAEQMFGRGAFGLAAVSTMAANEQPLDQAMWLLLWRTLRAAGLGALMDLLLPLAQQWQHTIQPAIVAMEQLRTEVPATAELLDPKQMGRGLRSKREAERRVVALQALREEHAEELDAFFAEHPELHVADVATEGIDGLATEAASADDHPQSAEPESGRRQSAQPTEAGEAP
jgi:hypothetical protein